MQDDDRIRGLADRLAAALPEPPNAGALDYLAWQELVWETAGRLGAVAGGGGWEPGGDANFLADAPIDGAVLLRLAAVTIERGGVAVVPEPDTGASTRPCPATGRARDARRGWTPTRVRR